MIGRSIYKLLQVVGLDIEQRQHMNDRRLNAQNRGTLSSSSTFVKSLTRPDFCMSYIHSVLDYVCQLVHLRRKCFGETYIYIFPSSSLNVVELFYCHDLPCRDCRSGQLRIDLELNATLTVSSMNLGVDLYSAVLRYHLIGDRHALVDWDALVNNRIVFHVRHTQHPVDLSNA